VQGVDVGVAVVDGELRGLHEEFVGAAAEQPGDLDGPSALGALALQVAGQEFVEGTVLGAGRAEVCRQENPPGESKRGPDPKLSGLDSSQRRGADFIPAPA
jgi:hypothetical protein